MQKFCFLVTIILLASCTIQKRTVNKGYFVQWHFKKQSFPLEDLKKNSSLQEATLFQAGEAQIDSLALFREDLPTSKIETMDNDDDLVKMPSLSFGTGLKKAKQTFNPLQEMKHVKQRIKVKSERAKNKWEIKRFNLQKELIFLYVMMALICLLAGLLFLLLSVNSAYVLQIIFAIISALFFLGTIAFLLSALIVSLFRFK